MAKKQHSSAQLEMELEELIGLADAAEAASVLLHDLGNVLNNLLLDTKQLQRKLPAEHRDRLDESCRLITEAAYHMNEFAQYRKQCRRDVYPVNLHEILEEILAEPLITKMVSQTHFDADLPAISATLTDLKQLLRLLLRTAAKLSTRKTKSLALGTSRGDDGVQLTVEISASRLNSEDLASLFEPFQNADTDWRNLELAMCQNLARRMSGRVEATSSQSGRIILKVSWSCT